MECANCYIPNRLIPDMDVNDALINKVHDVNEETFDGQKSKIPYYVSDISINDKEELLNIISQ